MQLHLNEERRAFLTRSLVLAGGATLSMPSMAQIDGMNEAINKAGRQRMLSQRMAKAWLAMGQRIEGKRAEKILGESMALFDRQFVELKSFAPTPEIKATYLALEPVWSDYKTALIGTNPDKASASQLLAWDAKVLKLANQGTVQLELYSGRSIGKLVNIAGRQRMLSQRTAKFYLSTAWGTAGPDQTKEMDSARKEFSQGLQVLLNAPEATEAIKAQLTLAQQQWVFFDNALSRMGDSANASQHAAEVFSSSENILQIMDRVTGLYSKLV